MVPNSTSVNLSHPINFNHPILRGISNLWLPQQNNSGGQTLFDISPFGRGHGGLVNNPQWTVGPGNFPALKLNGTNQNVSLPTASVPASYPITIGVVARATNTTNYLPCFSVGHVASSHILARIGFRGDVSGDPVEAVCAATGVGAANSSTSFTANKWHFILGVFTSISSRTIYLDGGGAVTDTTTPTGMNTPDAMNLGSDHISSAFLSGDIAAAFLWSNRALTANEVKDLNNQIINEYVDFLNSGRYSTTVASSARLLVDEINKWSFQPKLSTIDLAEPVLLDQPLNRGLSSWWLSQLNNSGGQTLFDIAGRNHVSLANGPTWTAGPGGKFGALAFNGSSQYAIIPFTMGTAVSWFGWVKFNNFTGATVISNWGDNSVLGTFRVEAEATPGQLSLNLGVDLFGSPANFSATGSTVLAADTWYRIGMTVDTAGFIGKLYLNGVLEASNNTSGFSILTNRSNIGLGIRLNNAGTSPFSTPAYFNGAISDGRLHSVAISAADAWADYEQSIRDYPDLLRRNRLVVPINNTTDKIRLVPSLFKNSKIDLAEPVVLDHPLNRGLISWCLPLDNNRGGQTLFDLVPSGVGRSSLTNAPTWGTGPTGKFGAIQFNGSTQYTATGLNPFSLAGDCTFALYMRLTSVPASYACYGGKGGMRGGGGGQDGMVVGYNVAGGINKHYVQASFNSGASVATVNMLAVDTATHLFVGTVSGTTLTGYVDGLSTGTASGTGAHDSSTSSFLLGCGQTPLDAPTEYSPMVAYSAAWWNRALSADEVYALYDQTRRDYPDLLRRVSSAMRFVEERTPSEVISSLFFPAFSDWLF